MSNPIELTDNKIELIKSTIAFGASNDELELFLHIVRRTQLDPFARQIYAIKRWNSSQGREVLQTQISIDGARLVAERSGKYAGQQGPYWCGPDGSWKDVWLKEEPPSAARVGVVRTDFKEPVWGTALWSNYVPMTRSGISPMWKKMGPLMLAKVAENLALRKSFPMELSGLYSEDEMAHTLTEQPVKSLPYIDKKPLIDQIIKIVELITEKLLLDDKIEWIKKQIGISNLKTLNNFDPDKLKNLLKKMSSMREMQINRQKDLERIEQEHPNVLNEFNEIASEFDHETKNI